MSLFAFQIGKLYFLRMIVAIDDIDQYSPTQMVVV